MLHQFIAQFDQELRSDWERVMIRDDPYKVGVLNRLLEDAAQPRKQLATDLGISESYVSKIVRELTDYDPYIKRFTIEIDYRKAGYDTHAISFIKLKNVTKEQGHSISEQIAALPQSVEVFTMFGEWDIYIRWLCASNSEIMESIDRVIDSNSIADVKTITLAKEYKRTFGPVIEEPKA